MTPSPLTTTPGAVRVCGHAGAGEALRALRDGALHRIALVSEPSAPAPSHGRQYARTVALPGLSDDAIGILTGLAGELLAPWSHIVVHPHVAGYEVLLVSRWSDVARDAEEIAWTRAAVAELSEFACV
jgi:hypothetical protein